MHHHSWRRLSLYSHPGANGLNLVLQECGRKARREIHGEERKIQGQVSTERSCRAPGAAAPAVSRQRARIAGRLRDAGTAAGRRDTKDLAKVLIERFGSYGAVLRANAGELQRVGGIGEAGAVTLKAVADAAERLAREEVMNRPVLSSWDQLVKYLRLSMIHHKTERFRILSLDVKTP